MTIILYILLFFHASILLADDATGNNVYYFTPGPNLVSFNILPENTNIDNVFSNIEYDFATLEHRLRELAFLNPGVSITITDARHVDPYTVELNYDGGLEASSIF